MNTRPRHPNKEIENAVRYAENEGWGYRATGHSSHAWGRLLCPLRQQDGCLMSIWSTPRVPINHARQIQRKVDQCYH